MLNNEYALIREMRLIPRKYGIIHMQVFSMCYDVWIPEIAVMLLMDFSTITNEKVITSNWQPYAYTCKYIDICDLLWKNRPLALKYDFAVGGSILDSTLFFRFLFLLIFCKYSPLSIHL